ncbi:uncharacterized protein [Antedon mediterranea]|uniref:uncharacterized protein n=1 Tax=Antedon mediterranea TaxID=105859 RepID=UPI003AF9D142
MKTRMIAFALFSLMINDCFGFGNFNNVQIHNNDVGKKDICYPVWEILASRTLMGCLLNYEEEKERNEIQEERNEIEKKARNRLPAQPKREKPVCSKSLTSPCPKK